MPRMPLARLAALALLATPLAQAQQAPAVRPYARVSAGGGVLPNVLDFGISEVAQNAYGVGASVEGGVTSGTLSLGLEATAVRSRTGSEADLDRTLPTSDYADAWQASAVVVARNRFEVGPVSILTGTGFGYGSTVVQSSPAVRRFVDGRLVGPLDAHRESAVTPLFHLDASVGRQFGDTFVGSGYAANRVPFGGDATRYGSARLSLAVSQTF